MPVIVDTCVFSLVLRRRSTATVALEEPLKILLARLIEAGAAVLLGPVRQELLSGIRDRRQFKRLRTRLRALPDPLLETGDFEHAAEASNACRAAGIAGSAVDFLLCGVSLRRNWPILTTDQDFHRYATVLALRFLDPGP